VLAVNTVVEGEHQGPLGFSKVTS